MRLRLISEFQHGQKPDKWWVGDDMNPDTHYQEPGAITFIYNADGTLHTDYGEMSHYQLVDVNSNYYLETYYEPYAETLGAGMEDIPLEDFDMRYWDVADFRDFTLPDFALLGRISDIQGNNFRYVSFWNDNGDYPEVDRLVPECLKALINGDFLSGDDVYVNDDKHMYVMDYLRGGRFEPLSPEALERRALQQQLHLMQPGQKKAAMKKLGLDAASRKQPWQKAAEGNKLVRPGQKWWAMQSESR